MSLGRNTHKACCCKVPQKKGQAYLVFEYANGRCLESYIQKRSEGNPLSEKELVQYCLYVAIGMQEIHDNNYFHCDIAAKNCLVVFEGNEDGNEATKIVKIADFRLARENLESKSGDDLSEVILVAPAARTAPEVWEAGMFTFKNDIFSLGITFVEIISGSSEFSELLDRGTTEQELKDRIKEGARPSIPLNIHKV